MHLTDESAGAKDAPDYAVFWDGIQPRPVAVLLGLVTAAAVSLAANWGGMPLAYALWGGGLLGAMAGTTFFLANRHFTRIRDRLRDALVATREQKRVSNEMLSSLPMLLWTCRADGPCDYLSPQWALYRRAG